MNNKVLLISPGGCACTSFIDFIKDYVTVNLRNDKDELKHTLPWNPSVQEYNATRIIYLYGDIDKAARSLFRRNYQTRQYRKLRNVRENPDIKPPFKNYKEYVNLVLKSKTEPLGILDHFKAWKSVPDVFFIHYENIPKSTEIDAFLGVAEGTCSKFLIKERKSEKKIFETPEYLNIMKGFMDQML